MKLTIGREPNQRRLQVIVDGNEASPLFFGAEQSVPQTVSKKHCNIEIAADGTLTVENIKEVNVTYVDGSPVFRKNISRGSKLELGPEKYSAPLTDILEKVGYKPTISLKPLQAVWDEYQRRSDEIAKDFVRQQNRQRLQGVCSMLGMFCALIPALGVFRFIFMGCALLLALFFFWKGQNVNNSQQAKMKELDDEFMGKYCCPSCGLPFMKTPYQVLKFRKGCQACGCKYTV